MKEKKRCLMVIVNSLNMLTSLVVSPIKRTDAMVIIEVTKLTAIVLKKELGKSWCIKRPHSIGGKHAIKLRNITSLQY